jgi:hypothetical protein
VLMREMIDGVDAAGVRTVGDMAALTRPSRPPVESAPTPTEVSTEAAANLLVGMMLAAGKGMPDFAARGAVPAGLDDVGVRTLLRYTAGRGARQGARRLRRG